MTRPTRQNARIAGATTGINSVTAAATRLPATIMRCGRASRSLSRPQRDRDDGHPDRQAHDEASVAERRAARDQQPGTEGDDRDQARVEAAPGEARADAEAKGSDRMRQFRTRLFTRIVPTIKDIG